MRANFFFVKSSTEAETVKNSPDGGGNPFLL
jgi:hypothetical protein